MEEILPFGWRGYYGNSEVEAKGLLSWGRGPWARPRVGNPSLGSARRDQTANSSRGK